MVSIGGFDQTVIQDKESADPSGLQPDLQDVVIGSNVRISGVRDVIINTRKTPS